MFAALFVNTSCDKIFGNLDTSVVDSYLKLDKTTVTLTPGATDKITPSTISDGAITYSSSDDKIATVDANGNITAGVKSGEATITAHIAESGSYAAGNASCKVKVFIETGEQFKADLDAKASDQAITIFLAENAKIDFTELYKEDNIIFPVTGTVVGVEGKPATITMGKKGFIGKYGLTFENTKIDAATVGETLFVLKETTQKAKKSDGTEVEAFGKYGSVILKNDSIYNVPSGKNFFKMAEKAVIDEILIDNCIIEIAGGSTAVFNINSSGYTNNFKMQNSTMYSVAGHSGYLIQSNGKPEDLEKPYPGVTTTLDHVTMYQIAKGQQMNNGNNLRGKKWHTFTLTNNILVYAGSKATAEVRGWLFGQESTDPVRVYENNTYWTDADASAAWTGKSCGDKSGTEITTFAGFKDVAKGDFTITSGAQKEKQTGDPRWVK